MIAVRIVLAALVLAVAVVICMVFDRKSLTWITLTIIAVIVAVQVLKAQLAVIW